MSIHIVYLGCSIANKVCSGGLLKRAHNLHTGGVCNKKKYGRARKGGGRRHALCKCGLCGYCTGELKSTGS